MFPEMHWMRIRLGVAGQQRYNHLTRKFDTGHQLFGVQCPGVSRRSWSKARLDWTGGLCGLGETAMATPAEMAMPTEQEVTLRGKFFFLRAAIETAKWEIRVDGELLAQ
jgi:hypothetical protein